jgi:hypothetical protein
VQGFANYGMVTLQPGLSYMTSGAPDQERWFVELAWCFPGVLLGSQALEWLVPVTVLGDAIALLGCYVFPHGGRC